jgi:cob(I)alamin adenosyltransferase
MTQTPRVLVFTGDGKGKTTAALGMAFRASGHGLRACMIQFIKSDASVGEVLAAAQTSHLEIIQTGRGFVPPPHSPQFAAHQKAAQDGLQTAAAVLARREFDLVILDEICLAVARGLLDEQQVIDLIAQTPSETCLVLTGRGATPALIALADTVTDMQCVKHGLQTRREAQRGVER